MSDPKQKLLVVEDELFIGFEIESVLEAAGYDVIGPVGNVTDALATIERFKDDVSKPVGAVLDANLNGKPIDPIADALSEKDVPFIFLSGYGRTHLPEKFSDVQLVGKPFDTQDLIKAVTQLTKKT